MAQVGGRRPGAGRPKGSKNKSTLAREAVAQILDVDDARTLEAAVHKRGHQMLLELERIVTDPSQPIGARIMAARVALPFMLPSQIIPHAKAEFSYDLVAVLQQRRMQLAEMRQKSVEQTW